MKFNPAKAIQDLRQFGEFGDVNPSITDSSTYTFLQGKPWKKLFWATGRMFFILTPLESK